MTFDFSKLKGLMREKGITQDELADRIGVSYTALNFKLNGKSSFRVEEIYSIALVLDIVNEINEYFFVPEVLGKYKK